MQLIIAFSLNFLNFSMETITKFDLLSLVSVRVRTSSEFNNDRVTEARH